MANFNSSSHQLAYGWFSLAAGGITGTGLGLGQSGTVPDISSDMIFAAVGEELGFLGIIVVLCLFTLFVGEGFRIAQRAHSDFVRLAAAALTATVGFQAFFIMAGVLRILPLTGITLPFMAYGGSSLLANYVIVALLLRISDENARERQRRRDPHPGRDRPSPRPSRISSAHRIGAGTRLAQRQDDRVAGPAVDDLAPRGPITSSSA